MSPHLRSSIPRLLALPTAVSCTCAAGAASCAAAHAAPPSRLTHRQFGRSSSSGRGGEGRPRLQSVVVQQQEGNTGRAAAPAAGCTTAADKYCRLRAVHHGDCCMLVPAAVQPTLALAVPPAMGAFARPGTFQQALESAARNQSFPPCRSTEQSAKSAKAQF